MGREKLKELIKDSGEIASAVGMQVWVVEKIADHLIANGIGDITAEKYRAGYRKQSETVKEFAEQIDLYLIKLFHQAHDSQKECEQHNGTVWENGWQRKDERMIMIQNDIQPFIRQLAEQFGKEEV